jgi:hypothetical protein
LNWTVVNGISNPIASTQPVTMTVNAAGVPDASGASVTVPSETPVVGGTMGWFAGRV